MHEALRGFQPEVGLWFEGTLGKPTSIQIEAWPILASGENALLAAPTGTGKTLAAFLCAIDRMLEQEKAGGIPGGLSTLYISPLRSLANDMQKNLLRPLEALGLDSCVRVAVRNGDTPSSERVRMLRKPPHILLTTPESLFVLLTSNGGRGMLNHVDTVIVDELHAILDSKRGTHLALSLERLEALRGKPLQRIGLSATVNPLSRAAHFLCGRDIEGIPRSVHIAAPKTDKEILINVTSPVPDMRVLPEGTIWPEICKTVFDMAKEVRTTLVFLNHRASCEKVAHGVNALYGGRFALTHHGCVSREQRLEAENLLKSGELRCLCATSSMELGIDVGEADLVLQVAPPFSVASGKQRLGRAGHNPGRESVMRLIPRTSADTLACGFIAKGIIDDAIEEANIPMNCLDVLAQHCVSMAATEDWDECDMLSLVRRAYPYESLTGNQLGRILGMLYGDYEHGDDKPVRPRLLYDRVNGQVRAAPSSRLLAILSGGTIPDRGYYAVMLQDGTRLGELDEVFIFEARIGDRFMLGSFAWQLERIEHDRVVVRPASQSGARSPFWKGDWYGRPFELGKRIGGCFADIEEQAARGNTEKSLAAQYHMDSASALNAARLVHDQLSAVGCLGTDRRIVVEHFRDETGNSRILAHMCFGGRVNLGIVMLLENALNAMGAEDVQLIQGDDGILMHSLTSDPLPSGLFNALPEPEAVPALLKALLPANPLFSMVFRYNAARALMMGFRKQGRLPLWVQRLRGEEAMARASNYPDHPLYEETLNECLNNFLDVAGVIEVLRGIRTGGISVFEVKMEKPSPMAIELRRMFESMMMYEDPYPERMRTSGAQKSTLVNEVKNALPPELQDVRLAESLEAPADAEDVHAMLMMGGDLVAGEVDVPVEWLKALARDGRAIYIDPGLWIAKEHESLYGDAFAGSREEMLHIIRRALRYRGASDAEGIATRYSLEQDEAQSLLDCLEEQGVAVPWDGLYVHRDVYDRASGIRRASLRASVVTAPPQGYAALLAMRTSIGGAPADRLAEGLESLMDFPLPYTYWEEIVLPARTSGYAPRMLDSLLQSGRFMWRLNEEGLLVFCEPGNGGSDFPPIDGLSGDESLALTVLREKGALFAEGIARYAHTEGPLFEVLISLAKRGLVTNDSINPLRLAAKNTSKIKERVSRRVKAMEAGRWEALRTPASLPLEESLMRAARRWAVLCRETARRDGIAWGDALELLRIWEYTGRVRRGYFVRGLSGAQFVLNEEANRIMYQLNNPADEPVCLVACDPSQAFGSILPHTEGKSFLCVPSTAVVLSGGEPVMVLEKHGASIRSFDDKPLEALQCALRAFMLSRIWPSKQRIVVKNPPDKLHDVLLAAGFRREAMDFVLWRKG